MASGMNADVVVVIGAGGIGLACAERLGPGRHVVLADPDATALAGKVDALRAKGLVVTPFHLDVCDPVAVSAFADQAVGIGRLRVLLHTAGRSPGDSSADAILAVNLLGAAHVVDAFLPHAAPGAVAVVIASIAAATIHLPPDVEAALATDPADRLLATARTVADWQSPLTAYALSKRANQLRVEAGALGWGTHGARLLSISPGVISTPMFHHDKQVVPGFEAMAMQVPAARLGTPQDIAAAVEWLAGPQASFITGCDFRIDGGMMSLQRWAETEPA